MIKNLLFDFGDVFINLDKEATLHSLSQAGYDEIPSDFFPWVYQYEKGLVTTKEFIMAGMAAFPGMHEEDLVTAWNAIILDFPQYRLDFIRELSEKGSYRLFLISNTNALHIERVKEEMGLQDYRIFSSCFSGFYLSHEIHLRKPEPAVFHKILKEHGLLADETFFVDDTLEHINSAKRLGLHSWHLQVGKEDVVNLKNLL